jgi:hypothetical protein
LKIALTRHLEIIPPALPDREDLENSDLQNSWPFHPARRDAFEAVDQLGQPDLRRVLDQQVDMILSPLNSFRITSKSAQTKVTISLQTLEHSAGRNTLP